jgi:D-sedoheptulose 7-phosphate isomerase
MSRNINDLYKELIEKMSNILSQDIRGKKIEFAHGVDMAIELILKTKAAGKKMMFIGNGASAAISSHLSVDFWKNGGIRAIAFNDASLLTCMGNDYGYPCSFEKPIEMFADKGDLLIAISSSGQSVNILNGARAAKGRGCKIITLSGFKPDNPLSRMGDINFYVSSVSYGQVEVIHHSLCHSILDMIMERKGKGIRK